VPALFGMILLAGLAIGAASFVAWKHAANTPQPWLARARVQYYLEKKSSASNFTVEFAFPSKADMGKAPRPSAVGSPKSTQADKDFETHRKEYLSLKSAALTLARQVDLREAELKACAAELEAISKRLAGPEATNGVALWSNAATLRERMAELQKKATLARSELQSKEKALAPVAGELQAFQERWQAEAEADGSASARRVARLGSQFTADLSAEFAQTASYEGMYRLIGQEIWVSRRLLASANPGHQRVGVALALDASRHALEDAQNGWVAARICEGYVWPHLRLATDANQDSRFTPENLLGECANIFRKNLEIRNVVSTYEKMLARPGAAPRADWARSQIAMACEEAGDLRQALRWWRQIQNTNDYRWVWWRLPALERELARK